VVLLDGGYLPPPPKDVPLRALLDRLLEPLVARAHERFASREEYRDYWRRQPMLEPADWNGWVEAYVDYDLGGVAPDLTSKIFEPGVRADFYDLARLDLVEARLRAIRVPLLVVRAETGFTRAHPPVVPDLVLEAIRACAPQTEDARVPGTTHYTLALADPGAARVAELLLEFAGRCES
jgi:pimeloyl-ACP methyl ester carboxylesterase